MALNVWGVTKNDEEQITVTDLAEKMQKYFEDPDFVPYGKQCLKSKLFEHYGPFARS